jgi:adenylosuccinate lyase
MSCCEEAGFPKCYSISTQIYTRKVDLRVANALSAFGATVQKIAGNIRHLAAQKEMEEPFEKNQIVRIVVYFVLVSLG